MPLSSARCPLGLPRGAGSRRPGGRDGPRRRPGPTAGRPGSCRGRPRRTRRRSRRPPRLPHRPVPARASARSASAAPPTCASPPPPRWPTCPGCGGSRAGRSWPSAPGPRGSPARTCRSPRSTRRRSAAGPRPAPPSRPASGRRSRAARPSSPTRPRSAWASALGAPLTVTVPGRPPAPLRLGALATTGLPGSEVVVSDQVGADLGLPADSAALLSAGKDSDPVELARAVRGATGDDAQVDLLTPPSATPVAFLTGSRAAEAFGAFSYRYFADGTIQPDAAWVREQHPHRGRPDPRPGHLPPADARRSCAARSQEVVDARPGRHAAHLRRLLRPALHRAQPRALHLPAHLGHRHRPRRRDQLPRHRAARWTPRSSTIFKRWGFRWGGDWSYTDPMHFEMGALLATASADGAAPAAAARPSRASRSTTPGRVAPAHAVHAAAGVRRRAAHVQPAHRQRVRRPARDRPEDQQLVGRRGAAADVAADQVGVAALQVQRGEHRGVDDQVAQPGRVRLEPVEHPLGERRRPVAPARPPRRRAAGRGSGTPPTATPRPAAPGSGRRGPAGRG